MAGYNLGTNADVSATEVVALTPGDGRAAFGAVTDADVPTSSGFADDGVAPDPGST